MNFPHSQKKVKINTPRIVVVPSLIISLNQNDIEKTTKNRAKKNTRYPLLKLCIENAPLVAKLNKLKLVFRGQGEGDTK